MIYDELEKTPFLGFFFLSLSKARRKAKVLLRSETMLSLISRPKSCWAIFFATFLPHVASPSCYERAIRLIESTHAVGKKNLLNWEKIQISNSAMPITFNFLRERRCMRSVSMQKSLGFDDHVTCSTIVTHVLGENSTNPKRNATIIRNSWSRWRMIRKGPKEYLMTREVLSLIISSLCH